MKSQPSKPAAKQLHTPIPELKKALAMPASKRAGHNVHKKPRRETVADYIAAIKAAAHKR